MLGLGPFESKVVGIACVILIFLLAIIGYILSKAKHESKPWPPTIAPCPDYWEDTTGTGKHCTNPHNLGRCGIDTIPPQGVDLTYWSQAKNRCEASKLFSDTCNLTWDGITNDDMACATPSKASSSSSIRSYLSIIAAIIVACALVYLISTRA
jgi:hypothetical protein